MSDPVKVVHLHSWQKGRDDSSRGKVELPREERFAVIESRGVTWTVPAHWLPLATAAATKLREAFGDALVAVVPRTKTEEGEPLLMLVAQVRMPSKEARQIRDKLYSEWWDGVDENLKDDVILGIEHVR